MGNVQISQELFMQLLRFHLIEDESCEKEIKKELEKKLDKMVMRDLFGKSKTAPTKEERERARKEYLDRRGTDKSRGKKHEQKISKRNSLWSNGSRSSYTCNGRRWSSRRQKNRTGW